MKLTHTLLTAAALSCFVYSAPAQTTFVFGNNTTTIGAGLDGASTGSFTVGGIEMTATTSVDIFNATASNFGINQSASGDDTDGFDFTETSGPGIAEGFSLTFDTDVQLVSFNVSSWNSGFDEVTLMDGATTVATITSTGVTALSNYALSSSSTLTVTTTAGTYGNGWSFESITVVPEPRTYVLLAGFSALSFVMLRRRVTK